MKVRYLALAMLLVVAGLSNVAAGEILETWNNPQDRAGKSIQISAIHLTKEMGKDPGPTPGSPPIEVPRYYLDIDVWVGIDFGESTILIELVDKDKGPFRHVLERSDKRPPGGGFIYPVRLFPEKKVDLALYARLMMLDYKNQSAAVGGDTPLRVERYLDPKWESVKFGMYIREEHVDKSLTLKIGIKKLHSNEGPEHMKKFVVVAVDPNVGNPRDSFKVGEENR